MAAKHCSKFSKADYVHAVNFHCEAIGKSEDVALCRKTLMAMAEKETHFDNCAVGDNGKAFGFLQINFGYEPKLNGKPITVKQAQTPMIAVNMAVQRLKDNGFPSNLTYSIQTWNGVVPCKKHVSKCNTGYWQGYAKAVKLISIKYK